MQCNIHKLYWTIGAGDLVGDDPVHRRGDGLNYGTGRRVDHGNDGAATQAGR